MKVKLIRKTTLTAISFDVLYLVSLPHFSAFECYNLTPQVFSLLFFFLKIAEFTSAEDLLSLRLSCRQLYTTLSSNASNTIWYRKRKELGLPGEKDIVNFKYDSDRWLVALSVGNHCSVSKNDSYTSSPVLICPELIALRWFERNLERSSTCLSGNSIHTWCPIVL